MNKSKKQNKNKTIEIKQDVSDSVSKSLFSHIDDLKNSPTDEIKASVFIGLKRTHIAKEDEFILLKQLSSMWISLNITANSTKILFHLFALNPYNNNFIEIDQKTIAERLNISERTVRRCINELVKQNVIQISQFISDKRRYTYHINTSVCWKGSLKTLIDKTTIKSISNKKQLEIGFNNETDN